MQKALLTLAGVLLLGFAACSDRDPVVDVEDDDPEMIAAMVRANAMLPQFWGVFENPKQGETDFAVKVKIQDKNGVEYFWATDLERRDGKIFGTIGNDPHTVKSVKLGERIEIPPADIADWLYMRRGKMVGNFTLPPLFKSMPPADVEKMKQIMEAP